MAASHVMDTLVPQSFVDSNPEALVSEDYFFIPNITPISPTIVDSIFFSIIPI